MSGRVEATRASRLRGAASIAAALALLAGLLAACGKDRGDAFAADADAICEETFAAEPPQVHNPQTDPEATARVLAEKIEVVEDRRDRLAELEPPEERSADWNAFLEAETERIELAREQLELLEEGEDATRVGERLRALGVDQHERARELGLEVCGHGRYAAADPAPAVPLRERLAELERAVEEEDCDRLVAISSTELVLDDPARFCREVFGQLEGFDAARADVDELGTAAVVEHDGPQGIISQPLVLDGDESFRLTGVFQNRQSVGEDPPEGAAFDEVADDAVEAIREGDCEALEEIYDPAAFASADAACRAFANRLATQLEADSDAAPEPLGANAWFAAYAVRTAQGSYATLLLSRKDADDVEAPRGGRYRLSVVAAPFR